MPKPTKGVSCTVLNESETLVVEIPAQLLINTFELGISTNVCGNVNDVQSMLSHFKSEFESDDTGGSFGRFLDIVAANAIENGESFVDLEDED